MNAKQAAETAKRYIADLMSDEGITDLGFEEVEFEDAGSRWKVTVGFSRPWDHKNAILTALGENRPGRSYKVIRISDNGEVESVVDRVLPASH